MVLQRMLGRLSATLGLRMRLSETALAKTPMIGTSTAALPTFGAPRISTVALPIIGAQQGGLHLAPDAPMIGTRRGVLYAEIFADHLIRWIRADGLVSRFQLSTRARMPANA